MTATSRSIDDLVLNRFSWWAQQGSNLRPLACKASALPLSYAPDAPWGTRGHGVQAGSAARACFQAVWSRASSGCFISAKRITP